MEQQRQPLHPDREKNILKIKLKKRKSCYSMVDTQIAPINWHEIAGCAALPLAVLGCSAELKAATGME